MAPAEAMLFSGGKEPPFPVCWLISKNMPPSFKLHYGTTLRVSRLIGENTFNAFFRLHNMYLLWIIIRLLLKLFFKSDQLVDICPRGCHVYICSICFNEGTPSPPWWMIDPLRISCINQAVYSKTIYCCCGIVYM
jgi:hypothetical protein